MDGRLSPASLPLLAVIRPLILGKIDKSTHQLQVGAVFARVSIPLGLA